MSHVIKKLSSSLNPIFKCHSRLLSTYVDSIEKIKLLNVLTTKAQRSQSLQETHFFPTSPQP